MTDNIFSSDVTLLKQVKESVLKLENVRAEVELLSIDRKRLEKDIEAEEKLLQDTIEETVKKRKEEITESFEKQSGREWNKLKAVKAKREKARNKGISERIEEETVQFKEENKQIRNQIISRFKKDKVPAFCNTRLYYALFFPKGMIDILILAAALVVAFLFVPGIILLFLQSKTIYYFVVYFVDIIAFCGIYLLINNKTKVKNMETLLEMRKKRKQIIANRKKIKKVKKSILKDGNENHYNLENFDLEIEELEHGIREIDNRKLEALEEFEEKARLVIMEEIKNRDEERRTIIKEECRELINRLKVLEAKQKELEVNITSRYEAYLGKEFMNIERLDALISIMESGKARTVSEALATFKNEIL